MRCRRPRAPGLILVAMIVVSLASFLPLAAPAGAGTIVSPDGWGWQNPVPQGNVLRGVWGESSSDLFAVGADGTIIHFDGSAWSAMGSATSCLLFSLWGSSSADVFAVGNNGTILHYDG